MLKKCLFLLLTGIAMLLCKPLSASAAAEVLLYDERHLLSEAEYDDCYSRLCRAADYSGMNIGVVLGTENRSDYTIESLVVTTYREKFGKGTDGILYYIDLKGTNPYDYLYASGMGRFYYTNARSNDRIAIMHDEIEDYLYPIGNEDIWGALMQFADEVEYFYDQGVPEHYYVYDDEYRRYEYLDQDGNLRSSVHKPYRDMGMVIVLTFFASISGIIAALVTFFVVKSRYKFKYSLSPTTYVNKRQVQYIRQYDHFVRTYTNKVRIESDSSSGGHGGGSHGGGGGGFSSGGGGGGGHHR